MLNDLCFIQNVENKLKNYIYYIKKFAINLKFMNYFKKNKKNQINFFLN